MRKFAVTLFAVLYAMSIVSTSAERFSEWVVREGALLAHSISGNHASDSGEIDKSETVAKQKRIVEPEYVVEPPREAVVVPIHAARLVVVASTQYRPTWAGQSSPSRAPPFQI